MAVTTIQTLLARRISTITIFLSTAVAAIALMVPADARRVTSGSALELQLLVNNASWAVTSGALAAAVCAVLVSVFGQRGGWLIAVVGMSTTAVAHTVSRVLPTFSLTDLNYIDSVAAGAVIGALGAVTISRRDAPFGFLLGLTSGVLLADFTRLPVRIVDGAPAVNWSSMSMPPTLLVMGCVALLAVCFHRAPRNQKLADITPCEVPVPPVAAALIATVTLLFATEHLSNNANGITHIVLAVAVLIPTLLVAALMLPNRDGSALLIAIMVSTAGTAVNVARQSLWATPVIIAAVALGLFAGRGRSIWTAAAAATTAALYAALTADSTESWWPIAGIILVATLTGLCFGSAITTVTPGALVASAMFFVPSLAIAAYCPSGKLMEGPVLGLDDRFRLDSSTPGLVALAVCAACASNLLLLRRIRT
ncbi:hypothetical protein AB0H76_13130 [Nocardia sp. NPDC050712]|uniref:hypothetical protein n=1 Tax=Nocardia sp. NPDC050712 TaxID=3155518 RepID=UPI00340B49C4